MTTPVPDPPEAVRWFLYGLATGHFESPLRHVHGAFAVDAACCPWGVKRFGDIINWERGLRVAFPGADHTVRFELEGDTLRACRVTRGIHRGAFFSMAATQRPVVFRVRHRLRLADGVFVEGSMEADPRALLRQIYGRLPLPPPPPGDVSCDG